MGSMIELNVLICCLGPLYPATYVCVEEDVFAASTYTSNAASTFSSEACVGVLGSGFRV